MAIALNEEQREAFKTVSIVALQTLTELFGIRFIIDSGVIVAIEV